MSSLSTLPKGDSAWLLRKSIQRIMQQVSVLETNIGSSTTGNSANTQVIFNDAGTLRGDSGLTYNKTTDLLTVGSATITGDLTVDTSTLKVDSANDRVGIGTASPAAGAKLGVLGATSVSASDYIASSTWAARFIGSSNGASSGISFLTNSSGGFPTPASIHATPIADYRSALVLTYSADSSGAGYFAINRASPIGSNTLEHYKIDNAGIATWSNVGGVAGTAMTLNATGLGVGVAPSYKLDVRGSDNSVIAQFGGTNRQVRFVTAANGGFDNANFIVRHDSSVGGFLWQNNNGSNTLLTIDSSGNVGIGVAPSASWNAAFKALQIGSSNYFSIASQNTAASRGSLLWNAIGSGDEAFVYRSTGDAANRFMVGSGFFAWYTAPSGTAGTTITDFATAKMTLDASGNLLVGTTSAGGNRLNVQTASGDCTTLIKSQAANVNSAIDYVSNYGNHTIRKSGTAVWDFGVINDASATPAFKVSNASAVGVQLVSGATSWTTLSDETMKDIIEPISNAVAKVGSLRSVIGKFKTDDASKRRSFLIAQDVQSVLPEAVDVIGENNELGLRYTEVIPLLVAAIKELTARVQTLEAR